MKRRTEAVDRYISEFPPATREQLENLRAIIMKAAPKGEEVISYGMPAYRQEKVLVYFAGYKNHIGFYPTSKPIVIFKNDLKKYKTSKGAIQFPIDGRLPVGLVTKIVKFRIKDVLSK